MTEGHELDAPPWLRVESTIMATARALRLAYDRRLAPLDLNLSEASLLAYIAESGPLAQARLAERLSLGRPATGSVVDSLERRGLVSRSPDPADGRVWLVGLTPAGVTLCERIREIDEVLRFELRHGIDRSERQQLAALLVRLGGNLASVLAEPPDAIE